MSSRFRVRLFNRGANFGRGSFATLIEDAIDIGVSAYASQGGEFFMTLPHNHPALLISLTGASQGPLQSHYEVTRLHPRNDTWDVIGTGIIDSVELTPNEVVVYGRDYLSLLETTISAANTSYTNTAIGTIISDQLTQARGETNSRVNFISMGTISATSTTATMLTSYQSRLEFISEAIDLYGANNRTHHPIISVSPRSSATPSFTFEPNQGTDKNTIALRYGGNVIDYLVVPNYGNLRTSVYGIGQKREGASILFSTQSYASATTYGHIAEAAVFYDVVSQAALDALVLGRAHDLGDANNVGMSITIRGTGDLGPFDGYDIGDNITLEIDREWPTYQGFEYVNGLFTVWGLEWIGKANGAEELFLDLSDKQT